MGDDIVCVVFMPEEDYEAPETEFINLEFLKRGTDQHSQSLYRQLQKIISSGSKSYMGGLMGGVSFDNWQGAKDYNPQAWINLPCVVSKSILVFYS